VSEPVTGTDGSKVFFTNETFGFECKFLIFVVRDCCVLCSGTAEFCRWIVTFVSNELPSGLKG
jgi:hypothetical protein